MHVYVRIRVIAIDNFIQISSKIYGMSAQEKKRFVYIEVTDKTSSLYAN